MTIIITLDKVKVHKKLKITFYQDPGTHIVKQYNKRVREILININEYKEETNMSFLVILN